MIANCIINGQNSPCTGLNPCAVLLLLLLLCVCHTADMTDD
jgi:hypothetical protein